MNKIKRTMIMFGIIFLMSVLLINANKIYAVTDKISPEEKASNMFQYIYDKTEECLSTLNMGWLLNTETLLNSEDVSKFEIDEVGVTLEEEINKTAKQQVKDEEITQKDILEYTKTINQAQRELESYKKKNYSDVELEATEHKGDNLKLMYENAKKIMNYVKTALNSAKNSTGNTTGDSDEIGSSGGSSSSNPSYIGGDSKTLEETMNDADNFLKDGNSGILDQGKIKDASNVIYNTLLVIGTVVAVIIGFIIAIQFMMGSVEEKAEVKKVLITYIIGCVILFGAFIIWKVVLDIANTTIM